MRGSERCEIEKRRACPVTKSPCIWVTTTKAPRSGTVDAYMKHSRAGIGRKKHMWIVEYEKFQEKT